MSSISVRGIELSCSASIPGIPSVTSITSYKHQVFLTARGEVNTNRNHLR